MINESPLSRKAGRGFVFSNHPKQTDFYMTFLLVNFAVKNATVFFPFLLSRTGLTISVSLLPVSDAVQCNRPCSALHPTSQCTVSSTHMQPFPQVLATILARTCDRPCKYLREKTPLFWNLFPFPYNLSLPVLWHTAAQAAESYVWISYVMRTGARRGSSKIIPIWEDPL